jgi:hypothetical protein
VTVAELVGGAARRERVTNHCEMTAAKSAVSHFGPNDGNGVRQPAAGR